jgi:hypothetical protein
VFVYFAINEVNLKMYVGKSIAPEKRWYAHIRAALQEEDDYAFHRAIRKYGPEAIHFDILEECESEEASLDRETYWIRVYDTLVDGGWGYNMTLGGDGFRLGPEANARRGQAIREALNTPESRKLRSEICKALWKNPEIRAKRLACLSDPLFKEQSRQRGIALWEDDDFRARCTAVMNEPARKEKSRQSLLQTMAREGHLEKQRELWKTPEYKAAQLAGVRTPEHRQLVSEATTARWQDPEYRQRYSETRRKLEDTPENLARKAKIIELRTAGMPLKQICIEVDRSMPTIYRVLNAAGLVKKQK